MRYHSDKPNFYTTHYGELYVCEHPIYDRCTLFRIGEYGLAVIQQRFDANNKTTYWSEIDEWIPDAIYLNMGFKEYFDQFAGVPLNGLYPTVTVRKIMWALKMKPLPKQYWETTFDHSLLDI